MASQLFGTRPSLSGSGFPNSEVAGACPLKSAAQSPTSMASAVWPRACACDASTARVPERAACPGLLRNGHGGQEQWDFHPAGSSHSARLQVSALQEPYFLFYFLDRRRVTANSNKWILLGGRPPQEQNFAIYTSVVLPIHPKRHSTPNRPKRGKNGMENVQNLPHPPPSTILFTLEGVGIPETKNL